MPICDLNTATKSLKSYFVIDPVSLTNLPVSMLTQFGTVVLGVLLFNYAALDVNRSLSSLRVLLKRRNTASDIITYTYI